ncbi:hypothetical protein [Solirubrobacter deserti]|uniref:Uncharacterized protein n=1 Tax=Solirubrobacter deserti TaxID=2282478 RepID=A0ABT4RS87_9ACTN|nr:hypothetical protein [Solirubrobacter deserti]MDA0141458.1 hypothetical protein [Solirubrobacter deserti]
MPVWAEAAPPRPAADPATSDSEAAHAPQHSAIAAAAPGAPAAPAAVPPAASSPPLNAAT